jgi:hypothetical protein
MTSSSRISATVVTGVAVSNNARRPASVKSNHSAGMGVNRRRSPADWKHSQPFSNSGCTVGVDSGVSSRSRSFERLS